MRSTFEVTTLPLWPEGVPSTKREAETEDCRDGVITGVDQPTLTIFPATRPDDLKPAVIVCPGGGYTSVWFEKEGVEIAAWLNQLGITACVLKYRLQNFGAPAPFQDVLRAVRLLRSEAAGWQVDPHRIGMLGASAGGHLAACCGTLFDDSAGKTGSPLDEISSRPDFLLLLYPVVTMVGAHVHERSRAALLGGQANPALCERWSVERQVTAQSTPAFIAVAAGDAVVPMENSVCLFEALRAAKVPVELHIYSQGYHGFAVRQDAGTASKWIEHAETWLRAHGWISSRARSH